MLLGNPSPTCIVRGEDLAEKCVCPLLEYNAYSLRSCVETQLFTDTGKSLRNAAQCVALNHVSFREVLYKLRRS